MPFIVKDLMISVINPGGIFQMSSDHCTGACCLNPCSMPSCDNASCVVTPITGQFGQEVINPPDLAILKQRLKNAIAEIEVREAAARSQLAPRTEAEAAALEEQLKGALEEVQKTRRSLAGKSTQK